MLARERGGWGQADVDLFIKRLTSNSLSVAKMFEEIKIGTAKEVLDYYTTHPDKVRGEFVVVVEGI